MQLTEVNHSVEPTAINFHTYLISKNDITFRPLRKLEGIYVIVSKTTIRIHSLNQKLRIKGHYVSYLVLIL